jgi:hypothetical protein
MLKQYWQYCSKYFSDIRRNPQKVTPVLIVLIVAGLGTALLIGSHAASPYASITADQGTTTCGASVVPDSTASDGSKVQFGSCNSGSGPTYYITQSGAGSANGSSCANAEPANWFNTSSWGTGTGQIGPGVTVDICANATISSALTFQGSGSSGNPITLYFQPGSTISMPVCPGSGCINTNSKTYLTIDGGSTVGGGGSDGVIQATENGSAHGSPSYPDQVSPSDGISAMNCSNCTIENLTIANLYVHDDINDEATYNVETPPNTFDHTRIRAVDFSGSNLTIENNTIHDVGWALVGEWNVTNGPDSPNDGGNGGDGNVRIQGNTISNIDHGFVSATGAAGGDVGPIYFNNNNVHDYVNWDTNLPQATGKYPNHHDGLHCYVSTDTGGSPPHYNDFYIYDNQFGGNNGQDMTAQIFLEGTAEGTPCADASSNIYVFNNNLSIAVDIANGLIATYTSSDTHVFNNTMTGPDTGNDPENNDIQGLCYSTEAIANEDFLNNIMNTCDQLINSSNITYASGSPDYNLYANGGENAFICNGDFLSNTQFSTWKSCIKGDSHSSYTSNAMLSGNGSPQTGSPAINAGTNLTSLCTGNLVPLCSNINGTPRPTSGPWNVGAY